MKLLANAAGLKRFVFAKEMHLLKDGLDILTQKDAEEKVLRDKPLGKGAQNEGKSTSRRCGTCGKTDHNARTLSGRCRCFSFIRS